MNTATYTISNPLDTYQYFLNNFSELNAAEGFVLILKNQQIQSTITLPEDSQTILDNDANGFILVEVAPTQKHYFLQQFEELKLKGQAVNMQGIDYLRIENGNICSYL